MIRCVDEFDLADMAAEVYQAPKDNKYAKFFAGFIILSVTVGFGYWIYYFRNICLSSMSLAGKYYLGMLAASFIAIIVLAQIVAEDDGCFEQVKKYCGKLIRNIHCSWSMSGYIEDDGVVLFYDNGIFLYDPDERVCPFPMIKYNHMVNAVVVGNELLVQTDLNTDDDELRFSGLDRAGLKAMQYLLSIHGVADKW